MIYSSTRPYGVHLVTGSTVKLKGAVILQGTGQWPYWAQFWATWDWPTIQRTIDNLATLGVNCLQVTATGLDDGGTTHPSDSVMQARIAQLAGYAASKHMVLNPQLGYQPAHTFAAGATVASAAAARMAALFAAQPNVAFIDAMNEVNFFPASGWGGPNTQAISDLTTFYRAIKAVVGSIPVTLSVGCTSLSDFSGSWTQAMAGIADFHNLHTYHYQSGATTVQASDFAALRAASWYQGRFVVGETGVPSTSGTTLQTNWLTGNGTVAQASDCLGSIVWGATDTTAAAGRSENVSNFGIMDSTGTTFRTALSSPLQGWPGTL